MKKIMLVVTVCFVVITIAVFFIYPYLRYPSAVNPEGVYIRYSEHEFGKEWDTLAIYKDVGTAGHYFILRRWKYERVLDKNTLAPEYKMQKTSAQFLDAEGLLVEEESGTRYYYNEGANELTAGTTIYKRIK